MRRLSAWLVLILAALGLLWSGAVPQNGERPGVEILRDRWGVPHVFAKTEEEGFFGVGYATAEDRILQMELFRRRARGRLAEVFGSRFVESDRKFRTAGVGRYCDEAAAALPPEERGWLEAYASGVNTWLRDHPEEVARRFQAYGIVPQAWRPGDSVCAWMAVATLFDRLYDPGAVQRYHEFRDLAEEIGEDEALKSRGMMLDDAAAVVPESEMAKFPEIYAKLKATPPTPGNWFRSIPDELLKFSHAWAVSGARSVTGKPLLESDPQTPVNYPPLWYEFHLSAGRFDVRGIGVAGSPGLLIGFNRKVAWGVSALGTGSTVTFIERLAPDGAGYLYRGETLPFERRREVIRVKGGERVEFEVRRTRHGFVFDRYVKDRRRGETYVSHFTKAERRATSMLAMFGMMAAGNWEEFQRAMEDYYSPGIHLVYADTEGNLGYQTLVWAPLTKRTRRMALEGWTGEDEILGRIPLDEMPHMLNPDAGFISHANNLPVGSWYPYDLAIGTGGTGHSSRSLRLVQLLSGERLFSVESFESDVHRDDVQANVAALFPVARRVVREEGVPNRQVERLLDELENWDLHYRADQPTYPAAMALAGALLTPYRRSPLNDRLGGGGGGISHLARLIEDQFGGTEATPTDPEVREYLMDWLELAGENLAAGRAAGPAPVDGQSREIQRMPYQQNGPMKLPVLEPEFNLESPPLMCGQTGTIWSQKANSYTQIVDLADVDNSRAVLPPGISEDPQSPFHANQMEIWAAGSTRPAPLSRGRVEEIAVSSVTIAYAPLPGPWLYSGDPSGEGVAAANVQRVRADGTQSFEAVLRYDEERAAFVAVPVAFGPEGEQLYLVLYGTGIRGRSSLGAVTVRVGDLDLPAAYAGPQGFYPGLDQVNVLLPRSLAGAGRVEVRLAVDGLWSNTVEVVFE